MSVTIDSKETSAVSLSLAATGRLNAEEQSLVERVQTDVRQLKPGEYLQREGERVSDCYFVRDGWLIRRREGVDGARYATNVFLPGDVFAMHLGFRRKALFDIVATTEAEVSIVDFNDLQAIAQMSDNIGNALDWNSARSFHIVSEHLINNMALPAQQRVLHLLLELWCRLMAVGQASDTSFTLPLRQEVLGQLLGLTNVTISKAFSTLRRENILTYDKNRVVTFRDVEDSIEYCDFDPAFLELFQPHGTLSLSEYT